ncbi:DUF4440 domain-containing protein [Verrucomicrobia bacterium LW23]|nr:DUF4440 domain-containing protein [Verrucomicrobia bacterium LW23]
MTTTAKLSKTEAEIQALLAAWVEAVARKDLDAIMAGRSTDMVAFDVPKPFQFTSAADYRQHWVNCLGHMAGDWKITVNELRIIPGEDVAFCHFVMGVHGACAEGAEPMDCQCRSTMGFRRNEAGAWEVTHEHHSVPMDCPAADGDKKEEATK